MIIASMLKPRNKDKYSGSSLFLSGELFGSVQIANVSSQTSGLYRCSASNVLGTENCYVNLSIYSREHPHFPTILSASSPLYSLRNGPVVSPQPRTTLRASCRACCWACPCASCWWRCWCWCCGCTGRGRTAGGGRARRRRRSATTRYGTRRLWWSARLFDFWKK